MKFDDIYKKIEAGGRLSREEGVFCLTEAPLMELGELATLARRRAVGEQAYYQYNYNINYTNICENECKFCAFFRKETDGYQMSPEQIADNVRRVHAGGVNEVHIVGGLNRKLPYCYYLETLKAIKAVDRRIHIQGFTAVEIAFIAEIGGKTTRETLAELHAAGLDSLPGGGAEIFADRVRQEICEKKVPAETWLRVHEEAHQLGLHTNATMLYGHVERRPERVRHMRLLREQQDHTLRGWAAAQGIRADADGGVVLTGPASAYPRNRLPMPGQDGLTTGYFQTIIPLPFYPNESELERLPAPTGLENLRTLAIARLMLDNFPHTKAFWIMQTLPMTELMLGAGADDVDGTVVWYDITKAVGEGNHQETSVRDLTKAIRDAGFTPVERDTLYRRVQRDGASWQLAN